MFELFVRWGHIAMNADAPLRMVTSTVLLTTAAIAARLLEHRADLESRFLRLVRLSPLRAINYPAVVYGTVATCLFAVGFVAAGQPATIRPERSSEPTALADRPVVQLSDEPSPESPAISVRGRILDEAGTPIAGAHVVLRATLGGIPYAMMSHTRDVLARTRSDNKGMFDFTRVGIPPRMSDQIHSLARGNGGAQLVCWSPGRAISWHNVPALASDEPVTVQLAPEAEFTGVVVDERGKGVAGARLQVQGITSALQKFDTLLSSDTDLNLIRSVLPFQAQTDAQGRFSLQNLPRNTRIPIQLAGPVLRRQSIIIDTNIGGTTEKITESLGRLPPQTLFTSPATVEAQRALHAVVKVIDHQGRPVSSGTVQIGAGYPNYEPLGDDGTVVVSLPKASEYYFNYFSDPLDAKPSASTKTEIRDSTDPQQVVLRLPNPRWLEGRVVDAETRQGVVGVYLTCSSGMEKRSHTTVVSGKNGRFRIPVVAGPGEVQLTLPIHGYFNPFLQRTTTDEKLAQPLHVNVPGQGEIEPITVTLSQGLCVRGVVRKQNGQPLAGATVRVDNVDAPYHQAVAVTDQQGRFEASGLSPFVDTSVVATSDGGTAEQLIRAAPDHPWNQTRQVNLELTATPGVTMAGRVLKDGQPVGGVTMKLWRTLASSPNRYRVFAESTTDQQGRYAVGGLAAGDGYRFEIVAPYNMIAPQWRHQSPYVLRVPQTEDAVITLPDANLVTRNQTLAGVVVNPQGEPVAGVTISCHLASGQSLSRPRTGPVPWTETDGAGRFRLEMLPDLPISLMAYVSPGPAGGRIRYPATIRPRMNQQDIRIVLDPKLNTAVEDLDK